MNEYREEEKIDWLFILFVLVALVMAFIVCAMALYIFVGGWFR